MNARIIKILEKLFKRSTIFKYGFMFNSAYQRSTGKVYFVSDDLQTVKIKIPLNYKNKNYKGTMYGGAMSSATDPIYMIQLITILGPNYVVWDKAASVRFKIPAKTTLFADFVISKQFLNQIEEDIKNYNEKDYALKVDLVDKDSVVHAEVERVVYIASKKHYKKKRENNEK